CINSKMPTLSFSAGLSLDEAVSHHGSRPFVSGLPALQMRNRLYPGGGHEFEPGDEFIDERARPESFEAVRPSRITLSIVNWTSFVNGSFHGRFREWASGGPGGPAVGRADRFCRCRPCNFRGGLRETRKGDWSQVSCPDHPFPLLTRRQIRQNPEN